MYNFSGMYIFLFLQYIYFISRPNLDSITNDNFDLETLICKGEDD